MLGALRCGPAAQGVRDQTDTGRRRSVYSGTRGGRPRGSARGRREDDVEQGRTRRCTLRQLAVHGTESGDEFRREPVEAGRLKCVAERADAHGRETVSEVEHRDVCPPEVRPRVRDYATPWRALRSVGMRQLTKNGVGERARNTRRRSPVGVRSTRKLRPIFASRFQYDAPASFAMRYSVGTATPRRSASASTDHTGRVGVARSFGVPGPVVMAVTAGNQRGAPAPR